MPLWLLSLFYSLFQSCTKSCQFSLYKTALLFCTLGKHSSSRPDHLLQRCDLLLAGPSLPHLSPLTFIQHSAAKSCAYLITPTASPSSLNLFSGFPSIPNPTQASCSMTHNYLKVSCSLKHPCPLFPTIPYAKTSSRDSCTVSPVIHHSNPFLKPTSPAKPLAPCLNLHSLPQLCVCTCMEIIE